MGWREINTEAERGIPPGQKCFDYLPRYAKNLHAVRELEDEIERRGLWFEYALAVVHTVGDPVHDDANYRYFQLLRATAAQRLEAICAVIDKEPRNA